MEKVTSEPYVAWLVTGTNDDRGPSVEKGVYKNSGLARKDARTASFWNTEGSVHPIKVIDIDNKPYRLKPIQKFADQGRVYNEEMVETIKAKLSEDEIKYLSENNL